MILRDRIQVAQSGPCSCSGKTPRDGGMGVIALALEGLYLPTQRRLVGDAPSEALPLSTLSSISAMFSQLPCFGV